jgi:tetratricopeptide (TPR) repeat protein
MSPPDTNRILWAQSIAPCAILVCFLNFATAHAQQRSHDFYAPRTGSELEFFRNVEGYHLEPGRQKMLKGSYEYAAADLVFILGVYPNHPRALDLMSQVCQRWKNSARCDADDWFEKAVAVNPNIATTYVVLGLHYHRNGKLTEAIRSYKKAVELEPRSLNAYYNLGLAYVDQRQFTLANDAAQHAYALGAPLPGLRDKVKAAGAWQPIGRSVDAGQGDPPSPKAP